MSRYPTADKIRQMPVEPSPTPYHQVTVDDILSRLFASSFFRSKMSLTTETNFGCTEIKIFSTNAAWKALWLASIKINPNDNW